MFCDCLRLARHILNEYDDDEMVTFQQKGLKTLSYMTACRHLHGLMTVPKICIWDLSQVSTPSSKIYRW